MRTAQKITLAISILSLVLALANAILILNR
jgi:hypothetical protein